MADRISFEIVATAFHAGILKRQVAVPLSAAQVLREGGEIVKKEGQRRAPVLTGALRDSIGPVGDVKDELAAWSLKIGPIGDIVHLYSQKEEARGAFMADAYKATLAAMPALSTEVLGSAWKDI